MATSAGERVAGVSYALVFPDNGWLLTGRSYASAGWVHNDGLFDSSAPIPGRTTFPVTIGILLYPGTPLTADVRFSTARPMGSEVTGPAEVETLAIQIPAGTAPGSYSIVFRGLAAYDNVGAPLATDILDEVVVQVGTGFPLRVTPEAGGGVDLLMGLDAAATVDYDEGLDELAPPSSPGGVTASLRSGRPPFAASEPLAADFRPLAPVTRWRLHVRVAAPSTRATLSWDAAAAEPGRLLYLQRLDHESPVGDPVDMTTETALTLTGEAEYEIAYGIPAEYTITLGEGWNLVGTPVATLQDAADVVGGAASGADIAGRIWRWPGIRGVYQPASGPLLPEQGYWVYCTAAGESAPLRGIPAEGYIVFRRGWNLVSPAQDCLLPSLPALATPAWWWDPAAHALSAVGRTEPLRAGRAYWILALAPTGCWLGPAE